jgi:hypothetical protein
MLQIDSVTFTGVTAQPAAMNGDFENWTSMTNYACDFWTLGSPAMGAKRTTDAHSGSYALELTTFADPRQGNAPNAGFAISGGPNFRGYPYTQTSDSLFFYYKYAPAVASDSAAVYVNVTKAGSFVGGMGLMLAPSATYKLVKAAFNCSATPDTISIQLSSSFSYPVTANCVGSDFKVDNLYLKSEPLLIREFATPPAMTLQPNPCNGIFHITTSTASAIQKVTIYNMCGNLIESKEYSHGNAALSEGFDISYLPEGMYLVQIQTAAGIVSKKVNKTN